MSRAPATVTPTPALVSQRRASLTFAFAIIGAMIVVRHHWFGTSLAWLKAPVGASTTTGAQHAGG